MRASTSPPATGGALALLAFDDAACDPISAPLEDVGAVDHCDVEGEELAGVEGRDGSCAAAECAAAMHTAGRRSDRARRCAGERKEEMGVAFGDRGTESFMVGGPLISRRISAGCRVAEAPT